jgi:O-antigen/teichoic acid export membrane protein
MKYSFEIPQFKALIKSPYFIVILETILQTVFTFATFSILVRLTDVKVIGLWILINSLLGFSRMADFWSTGLVSFVAQALGQGRRASAFQLVSTAVITSAIGYLLLVIVVAPIIYVFAASIPGVENPETVRQILPLMTITFWFLSMANTYQVGFLGFGRPGLKVLQTVGGAASFLIFALLFVPFGGLWGILIAQCSQAVLMLAFGFLVFHFKIAGGVKDITWDGQEFKKLISYGGKATLIGVMQIATDPLIRMLVSAFGGLAAVTAVELATRIIVSVRGLIISVGQILVPAFARSSTENSMANAALYLEAQNMFTIVTVFSSSCLLCLAPIFEHLILGGKQPIFIPALWLLCLGWSLNTVAAPAYFLLTGHRALRPLFWHRVIQLGSVVVLGLSGGKMFGPIGVVAGVSLGLAVSVIVLFVAVEKLYKFTLQDVIPSFRWIAPTLCAGVFGLIAQVLINAGYSVGSNAFVSVIGFSVTLLISFWALPLRGIIQKKRAFVVA